MISSIDSVARGSAIGGAHLERVHVAVEARDLGRGELEVRHTELARLGQDRVVDVGDVAHHAHLVTELFEPPDQQVVGEVGGRVAEVRRVVGRDAAHVHPHEVRRLERDDRAPRGVVERMSRRTQSDPPGIGQTREARLARILCRMLTVSSTGREGLHADGVAQRAAVERRAGPGCCR